MTPVRNFSIIAHIDHGKSTLADRLLELTGTIAKRDARAQLLDQMDLERERGVTIKLKPVRMAYKGAVLNLIDTPGHVDFSYEVSRSLAAVEGAVLVVDATQGIQAQTLAHFTLARQLGLSIIPVVNKIDMPAAEVATTQAAVAELVGCAPDQVLPVSAKTGQGVEALLDRILQDVPQPAGDRAAPARGLVFDAVFDDFRGVIAYVRVVDGILRRGDRLHFLGTGARSEITEVGTFHPEYRKADAVAAGEIGYVVTGLKSLAQCRVGDTLALDGAAVQQLPGYREPQPMVFASLYPGDGGNANELRDALDKLRLNDAALQVEGERSPVLGLGFRCGFLGLFHVEIVQERLRREHGQEPLLTLPMVGYKVFTTAGKELFVRTAAEFPDRSSIARVEEPWVKLSVLVPPAFLGSVLQLLHERRGIVRTTEALTGNDTSGRMLLESEMPLAAVLTNFFDVMKSRSSGFASMFYDLLDYRTADIVRLDILIAGEPAEELASLVFAPDAERMGRRICLALKDALPREQFEIRLQAAVGSKVLASERIAPLRKDVTAKLYGGDVTRKRKLLEKQKKGKKRMRQTGRVSLPADAYLAVVRKDLEGV